MKSKLSLLLICFLLFILTNHRLAASVENQKVKPWCWTKPSLEKNKIWDTEKIGGNNWGFCADDKQEKKIPYKITVETSSIKDADSRGTFFINLYGEEGNSGPLTLTTSGFQLGTTFVKRIMARKIGDITKIVLKNSGRKYLFVQPQTKYHMNKCRAFNLYYFTHRN
jgi:hypothetical protein